MKTLRLHITCKLYNQILSYLLCLQALLTLPFQNTFSGFERGFRSQGQHRAKTLGFTFQLNGIKLTSCKRYSLEWAALTGTQPCTVFGYKDFCGSTVLGMLESVGMTRQIGWQAQQISHLVCSLAGQRCSEA